MGDAVLPCRCIIPYLRKIRHQFPAHQGNIIRARHMPVYVQPAGIHKMRILHSQFLRAPVHALYKRLLTSGNKFCHCHSSVICWRYGNTFRHIRRRLRFSGFQKNLRAAHASRMFADLHHVLPFKFSILFRFINQQQRHNLCHTGRRHCFMGVFLIKHRTRCPIHQHRAFTAQRKGFRFLLSKSSHTHA